MEHLTNFVPKSGDEVSISGRPGHFIVHSVHSDRRTVDVRLIGPKNATNIVDIQWESLKLLKPRKREDFSQAAARIVREATEKA